MKTPGNWARPETWLEIMSLIFLATPCKIQGIFFAKKVVGHNFWTEGPTDLRLTFLSCIFDGLFGDTPLDHIFSHMPICPYAHMPAPSEILVSREFSRFFFNFHFSFSISSHLSFTFNSRRRVKGIYFSLFTSRKKWKLSEFHSFFSRKKSEIRSGVWPDLSLSSQILFFFNFDFYFKFKFHICASSSHSSLRLQIKKQFSKWQLLLSFG